MNEAFVHRALASAAIAGLLARSLAGVRVCAGALRSLGSLPRDADLFVAIDDGGDLAVPALDAPLAVVFASPVASALVASRAEASERAHEGWTLAREWAGAHTADPVAPAASPERLVAIADSAAAAGLTLVEPELPAPLAPLARLFPRPIDRVVLASTTLGALARPMLFVPSARAPKQVRPKPELAAWIRGRTRAPAGEDALVTAALDALAAAEGRALPFKSVLREARSARGGAVSTSDGPALAAALERLSHAGAVELYAVDPASPGWILRTT